MRPLARPRRPSSTRSDVGPLRSTASVLSVSLALIVLLALPALLALLLALLTAGVASAQPAQDSAEARPAPAPAAAPAGPLDDPAFRRWLGRVRADGGTRLAQEDDPFALIDACVAQDMARVEAPGASIAVAQRGELIYARGYGVKRLGGDEPVDPETLFRIGSTTKMMTAAAVMQQMERGTLDLQAPITEAIPGFAIAPPYDAASITLHQLLTHSAGIPDKLEGAFEPISLADWAAAQGDVQLYAPPGSFWNYSNPSFSLAGLAVQNAAGQDVRAYLRDEVWAPAGMSRTTMDPAAVLATGNYSYGHAGGGAFPPDAYDSLWGGPAGFAFSTPTELVTWTQLLMDGGGDVLSAASAEAMQAAQISRDSEPGDAYGYGIFRNEQLPGLTLLDHGGNIDGFSSQLLWIPEEGFAVSLLASSSQSLSNAARCAVVAIVDPEIPEEPDPRTDPATWAGYTGTYVVQDRFGFEETAWLELDPLADRAKALRAELDSGLEIGLVQLFHDTFQEDMDGDGAGDGDVITFIAHEEGPHPERAQWVRSRGFVGIRAGLFPREAALEGEACGRYRFRSHMTMPAPALRAWGPGGTEEAFQDLPIGQDDPDDPSSAGYKHDLRLEEPAGRLEIQLAGRQEDDLDLFLLRDENGDGQFAYPLERVASAATSSAAEQLVLGGVEPLPAGDYQVWVQGWRVDGEGATFDLRVATIEGEALAVGELPESIAAGDEVEVELCPSWAHGAGPSDEARALLVLSTGASPRHVTLPLRWRPEGEAAGAVYLPLAIR